MERTCPGKLKLVVVDLQLSKRQRQVLAGLVGASLLGAAAVAYAAPKHIWKNNETLTADDLNATVGDLDTRIGGVEQSTGALDAKLLGRLQAGTTAAIPQGSHGTVVGPSVNPSNTQMIWQAASSVVQTDANGVATIQFPDGFQHGVLSVIVQDGDFGAGGVKIYSMGGTITASGFQVKAAAPNGSLWANANLRFNWIAVGW